MRRATIGATAIAATLLFAACGSDSDSETTTTEAAGEASDTTAAAAGVDDPAACAEGKTLTEGVLTIATGNPAFPPYVIDDAPETGEGFEAALALAVAGQLGFEGDAVTWVRTGFDEAIQPGPKSFDFNLQQYSITPDRAEVVSFSDPYYFAAQAILGYSDSPAATVDNVEGFAALKLGAATGTTSLDYIENVIKPEAEVFVFNDNAAAKAALDSKQIDAIVTDLPTALFITGVEIMGTEVFGQFPVDNTYAGDPLGMLFEKDSPLVECVNAALAALSESGELAAIEAEWMAGYTEAEVIGFG